MINFRYNIVEVLGRGGGGEVLLAEDTLTKRRVAMKILEAADEQSRLEAQKEFSMLASLDHPNIIHVHDMGAVENDTEQRAGQLWYTMDFIAGKDAAAFFQKMRGSAHFGKHLERFTVQTLGALAYIHARGLTHFDIKPQNLLIAEGEGGDDNTFNAVLTDFGFSAHEVENVENPLRGTMEYTAPEIFQGREADMRSDLYSFGITLFELISGRCPFEAKDPVELIQRVLNEELPKLEAPPGVSAPLLDVIARLCKKNPEERCQSAEAALLELAIGRANKTIDDYIFLARRPSFIGRSSELQAISARLTQYKDSPKDFSGTISINAARGMGVSALLAQVLQIEKTRGLAILNLSANGAQSQNDEFKNIVMQLCAEVQTKSGSAIDVTSLLTLASSRNTGADTAAFLISASHIAPFVLLVDNFDQLSPVTRQILDKVIDSNAHILIVAANLQSAQTGKSHRAQTVALGELTQEDIAAMLRKAFPSADSNEMAKRLYALCGGIPRAVVPIIESVLKNQIGGSPLTETALEDSIPDSVRIFFCERLRSYSEPARRALALLACFETAPPKEIFSGLLQGLSIDETCVIKELLAGAEIAAARSDNRFSLRTELMKRAAYEYLSDERTQFHKNIALAFDQSGTLSGWRDMREHARQHEISGAQQRASALYEDAADAARKAERFSDAALLFRKAMNIGAESNAAKRPKLLKKLADTLYADGEFQASIDSAEEILKGGENDPPFRGSVLVAMGKSYSRVGEFQQAKERLREARTYLTDDHGRFEIEQEMIGIEIAEGKFDQAVSRCEKLKAAAVQIGDNQLLASVHTDLGIANFYRGMLDDALASFREAHRLYSTSGNLAKTVDASINTGNVLSAKGDHRGSLAEWTQALEESRKLGNRNQQAQILNNIGIAHYQLREYEKAGARYEDARAIFQELNSTSGRALTRLNLGEVALAVSHYETALDQWNIALRLYTEMNDPAGTADAAIHLAKLHSLLENTGELHAQIKRAQEACDTAELHDYDADIACLIGQQHLLAENFSEARASFCQAEKLFSKKDQDGSGDKEKTLRASIDLARTLMLLGDRGAAAESLTALESAVAEYPILAGEFRLLMGVCRESDAMNQYKSGLAAVADLDVTEITWKLMDALGRELAKRGNSLKAREHVERARMVLNYLADQFHSPELRAQYLNGKERRLLAKENARIESIIS